MSESGAFVSAFLHGIAAGAVVVSSFVIWRSLLSIHVRTAAILFAASIIPWIVMESPELSRAAGDLRILAALDLPVAGFFWLYVLSIFSDMRVTPLTLVPAALLTVSGFVQGMSGGPLFDVFWSARNIFGALLAMHAGVLVLRGWRDDLIEGRRRFRAAILVAGCVYVIINIVVAFAHRADPGGPWLQFAVGRTYGGLILAALLVSFAVMCLQVRPAVFGAARRAESAADARAEVADRMMLERLNAAMVAEGWRREGLTIGSLADELGLPEHRLRRLINQRLGHRNFAEFVNSYRIEAAKRRLADPAESLTTVAAIAFDLGYGSLGPFNRAFRSATGASPTEWRRQALAGASPKLEDAV